MKLDEIIQSFSEHDAAMATIVERAEELTKAAAEMQTTRETATAALARAGEDLQPALTALGSASSSVQGYAEGLAQVGVGFTAALQAMTETTARLNEFDPEEILAMLERERKAVASIRDRVREIRTVARDVESGLNEFFETYEANSQALAEAIATHAAAAESAHAGLKSSVASLGATLADAGRTAERRHRNTLLLQAATLIAAVAAAVLSAVG